MSVDPKYFWIDAWALEQYISKAEKAWQRFERLTARSASTRGRNAEAEAVELTEKALGLYRGNFLPADAEQFWTFSYRERIRSKFIRMILVLGSHLEQSGQTQKAVDCYLKGLEVDPLAEQFCQRLMVCYKRLGQRAEGLGVYRRCRDLLESVLGIPPSPKTESIHRSLQQGINRNRSK